MVIRRVYPNQDEMEKKLLPSAIAFISDNTTDEQYQRIYLDRIDITERAINTILKESDTFGLKEPRPREEETEIGAGFDRFKVWRRKRVKN